METRSDHLDFSSSGPLELGGIAFRFLQQQTTVPAASSSAHTSPRRQLVPQPHVQLTSPLDSLLFASHRLQMHAAEDVVMVMKADGSVRCEVTGTVQLAAKRSSGALLVPPASVISCVARLANVSPVKAAVTLTDSKTVNVKRVENDNNNSYGVDSSLRFGVLLEVQPSASAAPPCNAIRYSFSPEKKLKLVAPQFKCEVNSRAGLAILSLSIRVLFHPLLGGCMAKKLQVQVALAALPIASNRQLRLQPQGSYNEATKVASWAFDDHSFAASSDQGLVLQCLVALDGPAPSALPQGAPVIVRAVGCALKQLLSGAELSLEEEGGGPGAKAEVARTGCFDVRFL